METPPRTWGRPAADATLYVNQGNTPTHVGKTLQKCKKLITGRKHPHARGEDVSPSFVCLGSAETPPRTWGRRLSMKHGGAFVGNTPTHVGKTASRAHAHAGGQKHPHARGEDASSTPSRILARETPPRTWGRQNGTGSSPVPGRNTPTHVGKTLGIY